QAGALELGAGLDDFWADSRIAAEAEYKDDLAAAVAAMKELVGRSIPFALAGYSFGCSLLPSAAEGTDWPLALIAPTVGTHDYDAFIRVKNPVVVIAPRHDFAIDQTRLQGWFNVLPGRKQIVHGVWDDHFFRGFEDELSALVLRFLREEWEGATCR
ncbi:MAG TPA: hypothetical protein VLM40_02385, partial [Gemmata sp.]|nr:hypothetical protein [Gemmata sp.]